MNRRVFAISFCILSFVSLFAETAEFRKGHYSFVYPEGLSGIEEVADAFNALRSSFDGIFGFNPDPDSHVCRVRIFNDRPSFDKYIADRIGETRNQFIFLKYSKPELSELILYPADGTSGYGSFAGPSLNRQLLLQYLYSYTLEPPLWIRDGFQAWAERLSYDPATGKVSCAGYSPWLESAKALNSDSARCINVADVLSAVTGSYESARFYPQAWALVEFLLQSGNADHRRFLHEAFVLLEGWGRYNSGSQQENTDMIRGRFARMKTSQSADAEFSAWLSGMQTFAEIVQSGVTAYNAGRYAEAREKLVLAYSIRPEDPLLAYYLGLVQYADGKYAEAGEWYAKALTFGADPSTVNWALGLNALALGKTSEARAFLETARSLNPERYGDKVEKLLSSTPK